MPKGKFITFEGCEGCGKTTQVKLLAKYLDEHKIDYVMTREPGGTPVAEQIRQIVLNGKNSGIDAECEALLFAAARIVHIHEVIEPALAAGKLVICDRYIDSSFAYQGYAAGLGISRVANINLYATTKCVPDLTIFFDITPEAAFKRKHGADISDRMEAKGIEFHNKVYEAYIQSLSIYPRISAVDANRSAEDIASDVIWLMKSKGILKK